MTFPVTMDGVCLLPISVMTLMTVEITVMNRAVVCILLHICHTLTLSTPLYTVEAEFVHNTLNYTHKILLTYRDNGHIYVSAAG